MKPTKNPALLAALLALALLGPPSGCSTDDCAAANCAGDAFSLTPDSGITPTPDTTSPTPDSTSPTPDTAGPAADTAGPATDSATPFPPPAGLISVQQAAQLIASTEAFTLLDVRTPTEFASGHIEGAINLDWNGGQVEAQWSTLPTDRGVLVYCRSGSRSRAATAFLVQQGLDPVWNMDGGILAWQAAGLPTVQ